MCFSTVIDKTLNICLGPFHRIRDFENGLLKLKLYIICEQFYVMWYECVDRMIDFIVIETNLDRLSHCHTHHTYNRLLLNID